MPTSRLPSSPFPPPPPPPPPSSLLQQGQKYSNRAASALARFAQPFFSGSRPPSPLLPVNPPQSPYSPGASQTVTHKTGIPIATLDISPQRTHAVIAGKDILKTIRVSPDHSSEELNLRSAIISYSSTHHHVTSGSRYRDQLTVRDVKWSHGLYDSIIATAAASGRIITYDLLRPGLEFCRFQGHSRQVHRLAFNPEFPAWLLSGSQDSSIRLWDLRVASADRGVSTCGSSDQYNGNSDAVRDVRWSPTDASMFATATDSGSIQLWDFRKANAPVMRITAHDRPCFSVDWHPDGKHIASAGIDRQIKIWDFSPSAERRQKPTFQFRSPQAVLSLRWRPPSWSGEPSGPGGWQSSQIVTLYDKDDTRVHLWDLRRPHIPSREFDRYDSSTTDLLWHSKDLLWTVGSSGVFTQTDIRYAPQVIRRRPTCSIAWSPSGEVLAFMQRRSVHGILDADAADPPSYCETENSTDERLRSRVPADDISDESTSRPSMRRHYSKSPSVRQSKSLGNSPPDTPVASLIISLEKTLPQGRAVAAHQLGIVGNIPGATVDEAAFRYLASHYSPLINDSHDREAFAYSVQCLLQSFDNNAERAEYMSLPHLAQTWRIVKHTAIHAIQRDTKKEHQSSEIYTCSVNKKPANESQLADRSLILVDNRSGQVGSRRRKEAAGAEGYKAHLLEAENTSNVATSVVRSSPGRMYNGSNGHTTSLGEDVADLQVLPRSASLEPYTTTPNESVMSEFDENLAVRPTHRESQSSEDIFAVSGQHSSYGIREAISQGLRDEQRSMPWEFASSADWRSRGSLGLSDTTPGEDDYDQKMETKRAAISDYRSFPKNILSLESPISYTKPPVPHGRESAESFTMFSASTDSSNRAKSIGISFSPKRRALRTIDDDDGNGGPGEGSNENIPSPINGSMLAQDSDGKLSSNIPFEGSLPETGSVHLERPSSPPSLLKETFPINARKSNRSTWAIGQPATCTANESFQGLRLPIDPDLMTSKPWSAEIILKEAIRHYHSSTLVDVQTAAHLLHKLHLLFGGYGKILPHEECELIYRTYNEYLIRQSMYAEAAELRLNCESSYPAVYEYAQLDTFANVFCFTCKRPYENPRQDNRRCYRCNTPQEPCPICMSIHPPPEWASAIMKSVSSTGLDDDRCSEATSLLSARSSTKTEPLPPSETCQLDESWTTVIRPKGAALWAWCQGCGHGGHVACMTLWLGDMSFSEGACATPGCTHDCGPGRRREQNRAALLEEEAKRRDSASRKARLNYVTRDPWAKGESRAVEKVRGMLNIASGIGTSGAASTTSIGPVVSSGTVSPKKVRLVTPTELSKERTGAGRTGAGSASTLGG